MCVICVQHELGKLTDAEALRNAFEASLDKIDAHMAELLGVLYELNKESSK